MAGLTAARQLVQHGHDVVLLDKGRGVGGRMATRRLDTARADHGAQYFSATTPAFRHYVDTLKAAGVVTAWHLEDAHVADTAFTHPRYIGVGGMSAITKHMADGLTVYTNQKVVRVTTNKTGWRVDTEAGDSHQADALVSTVPAPQAITLLQDSGLAVSAPDRDALSGIVYEPCLAVLASLSQPSRIPAPGAVRYERGDVAWIADNQQKGVSSQPSVTLHASADFSRKELDRTDLNAVGQKLLDQAQEWVSATSVVEVQVHRWRYSRAAVRHPEPFLAVDAPFPLLLGGDGFGAGNVEGAFTSGLQLANALLL